MRAVEVERVGHVGVPSAEGFVIGRVVSAERHPNADRLSVCEVDTGGETRTIVCGAPNVAAGQTVPVALPGAVMPGGDELGRAKLRGVVSDGMILSEVELEVGSDADGIIVLADDGDFPPGTPLIEVLPISEAVLELDLNPNRSDCFGVYGVAREVHAITGAPLAPPPWDADAEPTGRGRGRRPRIGHVEVPELCPRFTAARLHRRADGPIAAVDEGEVDGGGTAPDLQRRRRHQLRDAAHCAASSRLRPRQGPGRRADRSDCEGRREDDDARRRRAGLRRRRRSWSATATARPGSRGSWAARSRRSPTTPRGSCSRWRTGTASTSCAPRDCSGCAPRPPRASRSSSTPSSRSALSGSRRSSSSGWARRSCRARSTSPPSPPRPHVISLHGLASTRTLGTEIPLAEATTYLERLGFGVETVGDDELSASDHARASLRRQSGDRPRGGGGPAARLRPPAPHAALSWRAHGRAQRGTAAASPRRGRDAGPRLRRDRRLGLRRLGSVRSPAPAGGRPPPRAVAIANPLSEDQSVMRTTLLGGLLDAARHNTSRGIDQVALFESGPSDPARAPARGGEGRWPGCSPAGCPRPRASRTARACLATGALAPAGWRSAPQRAGFYELKGGARGRLRAPRRAAVA